MSLIVHLLVENTVYAYGAILTFLIENDVMPDLVTKKTWLDDVICLFEKGRNTVQTLDSGINLSIINDSLLF